MLKKLVKLVTSQRVNFFFSISALPSVIQSTKNILWVSLPPLNLFNIQEQPCPFLIVIVSISGKSLLSTKNNHWSSKSLSHAGRKTLIQSVTSAIPTHWFATQQTSQKIFHHIDSLNSRFLWKGKNDHHRHLIPISCSHCAKNICFGGLGLCNAFLQAQSFLLYLAWLFLRYPHQLWATY